MVGQNTSGGIQRLCECSKKDAHHHLEYLPTVHKFRWFLVGKLVGTYTKNMHGMGNFHHKSGEKKTQKVGGFKFQPNPI